MNNPELLASVGRLLLFTSEVVCGVGLATIAGIAFWSLLMEHREKAARDVREGLK